MTPNAINQVIADQYCTRIIDIFENHLQKEKVELYLFGSRASGMAHEASDIDIAVKGAALSAAALSNVREALQESHIPYKIDLIYWNKATKAFKESINKEGILIWQN